MRRALLGGAVLAAFVAVQAQNLDTLGEDWDKDNWGVDGCAAGAPVTLCCCATGQKGGSGVACGQTELFLCAIESLKKTADDECTKKGDEFKSNADQLWIIMAGSLVFFMQCGFAMLEAGCVRSRNTQNIIFKNLLDVCMAALSFFAVGYAFAYGDNTPAADSGNFIAKNNFFLMKENNDETGQHGWFFQFAFAATAATIVSGSVAERTELKAYFVYSIIITVWIYPVVVHWVWSGRGWLSAFSDKHDRGGAGTYGTVSTWDPNGMVDYAGSGVVHAVGGWAGLVGAWMVGPRIGRFEEIRGQDGSLSYGKPKPLKGQSTMLGALGVLILWFGWYGFNCGSTLAWDGENAGKVATTTTLAAGTAGIVVTFIARFFDGIWAVDEGLNGILAGLVSITAGCSVVDEWPAVCIGAIGAVVYYLSAKLLLLVHIDDPLNAWPVHGACGVWGVLAVGIFMTERNFRRAYAPNDYDYEALDNGTQFAVQLLGITCIVAWTVGNSLVMFGVIKALPCLGLRVKEEVEREGMDVHHHGALYSASFLMDPNSVGSLALSMAEVHAQPQK